MNLARRISTRWLPLILITSIIGSFFFTSAPTHGESDISGCLEYADYWGNHGIIDLKSGLHITDAKDTGVPANGLQYYIFSFPVYSPDRRYEVYPSSDNKTSRIILKQNVLNGQQEVLQNISVSRDTDARDYQWSPDSHWLAFVSPSPDGGYRFSIIDPETNTRRVVPLQADPNDTVHLFGWSGTGHYIAIVRFNAETDKQEIGIWSASDLKLVKTISLLNLLSGREMVEDAYHFYPNSIQWSPSSDWLAYQAGFAGKVAVNLVSPNSDQKFSIQFSDSGFDQSTPLDFLGWHEIFWSPNGKYLAFLSARKTDWRLDIIGINGKKFEQAANHVSYFRPIAGGQVISPLIFWSADSNTLFYAQDTPKDKGTDGYDHADLTAFQPDLDKYSLIQSKILLNPSISSDGRYAVYVTADTVATSKGDMSGAEIEVMDTSTFGHITFKNPMQLVALAASEAITSETNSWLLIYEGTAPFRAINTRTGIVRNLEALAVGSGPTRSLDNRFLVTVFWDSINHNYDLRWLSLDDGSEKTVSLPEFNLLPFPNSDLLIESISHDGSKIVIATDASYDDDHFVLTVVRPDGSVIQQVIVKKTPFLDTTSSFDDIHFSDCEIF